MPSGKGRPRKPTALKLLHGDFEKDPQRRNTKEPKVDPSRPVCPSHLTLLAKNEWKRICNELAELGVLTRVERASLEQYCEAYSKWRECLKTLKQEGHFYSTEKGIVEHPAGRALRSYAMICHRLLCEFGLTPSSRSRLQVSQEKPDDSLERKYLG